MTRDDLFYILRPIIIRVTGVSECILLDPNAPSPNGEYASIEPYSSIDEVGQGWTNQEEVDSLDGNPDFKDLKLTVISSQEVKVSVNFYRGEALNFASKLLQADKLPSTHDDLFANGLGWMRVGAVNNLTALNQARFEQRAQIDIFLRRLEEVASETVQQIYSVGYEIENEDGTVISNG